MVNERERDYRDTNENEMEVRSTQMRDEHLTDDRVLASEPATYTRREPRPDYQPAYQVVLPEALNFATDRVRWGPIWAGLLVAIGSMMILSLAGVAVGLTGFSPGADFGGTGGFLVNGSVIWAAAAALISFFIGGLTASRVAAVFDRSWGAFNGAMVFLLAIPVTLILGGAGLGGLLGLFSDAAFGFGAGAAGGTVIGGGALAAGAWGALMALLLGLAASAIGGALGTRRKLDLQRTTGRVQAE